jgi:plastocyanin
MAAALAGLPGAFRSNAPVSTPPRRTMVVTSYEYTFQAPDSIAAGVVTVRLVNHGKVGHQASLARLDDSTSLIRVMRSLVENRKRTTGIRWVGGVESARSGDSSETTLALEPGRYVIVCAYDEEGHPHMSRGMLRALTVTGAAEPRGDSALPLTPVTIRLSDYRISLSGPLHAGRQLVRVENAGAGRHHLIFSRFTGNATMAQLDQWDGKSTPAPVEDISGGAAIMSPGEASVIALNLRPGRYALACILNDTAGSKPHFMLGMEREVIVK